MGLTSVVVLQQQRPRAGVQLRSSGLGLDGELIVGILLAVLHDFHGHFVLEALLFFFLLEGRDEMRQCDCSSRLPFCSRYLMDGPN